MSGGHDIQEAQILQGELNGLFNAGQFSLRKWASNEEKALDGITMENRAIKTSLEINKHEVIKTLGMAWSPETDTVGFTIDMTKLSQTAKLRRGSFYQMHRSYLTLAAFSAQ